MKKFSEISKFLKTIRADYKSTVDGLITKKDKSRCYWNILYNLLWSVWNTVTTFFIYPIWYVFRKPLTDKIHRGTSWQEIEELMRVADINGVESRLKVNGNILFWLWTYGDCSDPYGWGGMPTDFRNGKNNFWNRYIWSAVRNPRFNINYLYYRTGIITEERVIIDTRNPKLWHKSYGVGSSENGLIFKWLKDNNGKWYFIYEENNYEHVFWFGYVGLKRWAIGKRGRFELSYRKTQGSYTGDWHP